MGAVDLVAIREAEISEKSREAERMEQTALREAEELGASQSFETIYTDVDGDPPSDDGTERE